MAPRIGQAPSPRLSPSAAPRAPETQGPDAPDTHTVKKGDTLWKIAKQLVQEQGGKPTDAAVGRTLAALKAANPELCTPARHGGDKIFPGDVVRLPPAADWKPRTGAPSTPAAPSAADRATAQEQMAAAQAADAADAAQQKQMVGAQLQNMAQAVGRMGALSPEQKSMVQEFLAQLQEVAPELLQTPEAATLAQAAQPGAGDAASNGRGQPTAASAGAQGRSPPQAPTSSGRAPQLAGAAGAGSVSPDAAGVRERLLEALALGGRMVKMNGLPPEQLTAMREMLNTVQRNAPDLLQTPDAKAVAARVGWP